MGEPAAGGPDRRDVRDTYERIGEHFSKTRANPWPEVRRFLEEYGSGGDVGVALDVGCGNGRHTELLADVAERAVGLDAGRALLSAASRRCPDAGVRLLQGDAAALPLVQDGVDLAVYVATLHHLPDRRERLASLDELARVLAPDGWALVSAWSSTHDRFDAPADAETGFDTTVDWTLPDGTVVDRFYHIYAPAEFRRDLADSTLRVDDVRVSSGNCYGRVRGRE